jgi:hypothetical protein
MTPLGWLVSFLHPFALALVIVSSVRLCLLSIYVVIAFMLYGMRPSISHLTHMVLPNRKFALKIDSSVCGGFINPI